MFQSYKGLKYLLEVDSRDVPAFYAATNRRQLGVALAGAPEAIVDKLMRNLGAREVAQLEDIMNNLGPLAAPQVLNAQQQVVERAEELVEKGLIRLQEASAPRWGDEAEMGALFLQIPLLPDPLIHRLVRDISWDSLPRALLKAPPEVISKFTVNLSRAMNERLSEDMGALGPVRESDVLAAQCEIARVLKELIEKK